MLSERFAESIIHARPPWFIRARNRLARYPRSAHVVCGLRLRPFALWHAALLDWLQSPLAGHKGEVDLATLVSAAQVCACVYPERPHPSSSLLLGSLLNYRFGRRVLEQHLAFLEYVADYGAAPIFDPVPASETAAEKCPGYFLIAQQLRLQDARLSERDAWMAPVGYALWLKCAHAQLNGSKLESLVDDEDLEVASDPKFKRTTDPA